jgi:hypothetical protein
MMMEAALDLMMKKRNNNKKCFVCLEKENGNG